MTYKPGVDVSSTTPKAVVLSDQDEIMYKSYEHYKSRVWEMSASKLKELYELLQGQRVALAITGNVGLGTIDSTGFPFVQEVFITAQAVREYYLAGDVVIELDGEDARIIFLQGTLEERMNSTCAGGTGTFIDQMATLLDADLETMDQLSLQHTTLYSIASRCGVFAKSDIQPLINRGCGRSDFAASIFRAVVDQSIAGLAQGRNIEGNVLLLEGPLHFLKGLQECFKETLKLRGQETNFPELAPYFTALGSAVYATNETVDFSYEELLEKMEAMAAKKVQMQSLPPLFESDEDYEGFKERHISASVERSDIHTCRDNAYLGIDVGSTTTKLVLIDGRCRILYESYAGNMENPVDVAQEKLAKLYALTGDRIHIIHSVVTGYGKELVRHAFHLDIGVVETIAHHHATHYFNPQVDFIIDVDGQDMKYSRICSHTIDDVLLGKACSNSCGSFIETFAKSMGHNIEEFVRMGLSGKHPVDLGTRCAVFMNSSVEQAQKNGVSMEDISADLCMSVMESALCKVVCAKSPDDIGKQIIVQGETFLNNTVLRSFELELGRSVICPSISHLMGAYGAVLIAREKEATASSLLKKENVNSFTHSSKAFHYALCANHCSLTVNAFASGVKHITGSKCERPVTGEVNREKLPNLYDYKYDEPLRLKGVPDIRGRIGIPLVLNPYDDLPFWHSFFTSLGYGVILSDRSSKAPYSLGQHTTPSNTTCYPAKLVHGHIQSLISRGLQAVFYPCMTYNINEDIGDNHFNCSVAAYYPEAVEGNMNLGHVKFSYPYVYLEDKHIFDQKIFEYSKARQVDIPLKGIQAASNRAYFAYRQFKDHVQEEGRNAIAFARRDHRDAIVLAGCPYHVGPQINHGTHRLLDNLGFVVTNEDSIAKQAMLPNVHILNQWTFHSRIYDITQYAVQQEHIELIQLVGFGCGIDTITADEVKDILRGSGKLYTQIKIDEADNLGAVKIRCHSLQATMEEREG